jgi:hypothetical protein
MGPAAVLRLVPTVSSEATGTPQRSGLVEMRVEHGTTSIEYERGTMAVNIVDTQALEWSSVGNTWAGKAPDGQPGVRFKPFTIGEGSVPRGQLVEYEPGHFESAHSHGEDEILFLLSGQLSIADKQLSPGTLISIEGGTLYGPLKSEQGCHFLRLHIGQ